MNDILTTGQVILQFFGAVAIIGGGWKVIAEWLKPNKELKEKVHEMDDRLNDGQNKFDKIEKTLNAQSVLLIEISNHLITGNDKDALKKKSDELLDVITKGE